MKKTKLFITGMGGMTGRTLAKLAINENFSVGGTIHQNLPSELQSLLEQGLLKKYSLNLNNSAEIKNAILDFQPGVVIHLAGKVLGSSDKQVSNPKIYIENITILKNVLSAIKNLTTIPKFVLSSGCLVYNKLESSDFINELSPKDLPNIDSGKEPYRASRIDQEKILTAEGDIDYIIARPTQITGPGKIPGVIEWYIAQEISKIIAGEDNQIRVKNKLGEVDILDVRDVATAYITLIKYGRRGEVYHISSGSPITVEDLAKVFLKVADLSKTRFQIISTGTEIPTFSRFSPKKLKKLGWEPEYNLEEALLSYWKYFNNQQKNEIIYPN